VPPAVNCLKLESRLPGRQDVENMMISKFSAVTTKLVLLTAAVAVVSLAAAPADAQQQRKRVDRGNSTAYGPGGPNSSYQQGPRTRIYVTKRSWLDAGTEVLPGERKFTDYAFPPGYSFARENKNWPLDRQPLNPPSDLGGYPERFPLY